MSETQQLDSQIKHFSATVKAIETNLSVILVGMDEIVRLALSALFAGGHVLLEGAPGLGKTLLVKSIAKSLGLSFNRIQFTSDLMPSDITGTQVLTEDESGRRKFQFKQGPIFSNVILADEVNRAGPKTQSALLEAMEEKQVTVLGTTYKLPQPYFVLATQNPIELEGTYPLPEAQLDRFLLKLLVSPPNAQALKTILARTTGAQTPEVQTLFTPEKSAEEIIALRNLVRRVVVAPHLEDILVGVMFSLSPGNPSAPDLVNQYVRFGPGPRGAQAVLLAAKVQALLDSRINLSYEDISKTLLPALRHRLILNYQADADGVTADKILEEVLKSVA
ncbi:AAA family ATPase [bacterium]|nr:AAA family ATPase [bacterium]